MTRYKEIKDLNFELFIDWLDRIVPPDNSDWTLWFDKNYCKKCSPIIEEVANKELGFSTTSEKAYCECYHKCKFFPNLDRDLSNKDVIRLWLKQKI